MTGIFSERRLVKVVGTDQNGLPTEEIVRESLRRRFRALAVALVSHWMSRLSGLTPIRRLVRG